MKFVTCTRLIFLKLNASRPVEKKPDKAVFHGDFNMEFCDDMPQLLQAYFRDFTVENLDKPWQAFTGSWTPAMTARNLGLNISYVSRYVISHLFS